LYNNTFDVVDDTYEPDYCQHYTTYTVRTWDKSSKTMQY